MALPALSWLLCAWYTVFYTFIFNLFMSLNLNYISSIQYIVDFVFLSSLFICILSVGLNTFTFCVLIRSDLGTPFWFCFFYIFLFPTSSIIAFLLLLLLSRYFCSEEFNSLLISFTIHFWVKFLIVPLRITVNILIYCNLVWITTRIISTLYKNWSFYRSALPSPFIFTNISLYIVPINLDLVITVYICILSQTEKESYKKKIHTVFYIYLCGHLYWCSLFLHVDPNNCPVFFLFKIKDAFSCPCRTSLLPMDSIIYLSFLNFFFIISRITLLDTKFLVGIFFFFHALISQPLLSGLHGFCLFYQYFVSIETFRLSVFVTLTCVSFILDYF